MTAKQELMKALRECRLLKYYEKIDNLKEELETCRDANSKLKKENRKLYGVLRNLKDRGILI